VEISPGKSHILRSIAAASTPLGLLPTSVAVMCLLTHPKEPLYAVPARPAPHHDAGSVQTFAVTLPLVQGSLPTTLRLANPAINGGTRDLHPLDIQRTMLPCGSLLGPCWAHTKYKMHSHPAGWLRHLIQTVEQSLRRPRVFHVIQNADDQLIKSE
jgi:hypothetical protein